MNQKYLRNKEWFCIKYYSALCTHTGCGGIFSNSRRFVKLPKPARLQKTDRNMARQKFGLWICTWYPFVCLGFQPGNSSFLPSERRLKKELAKTFQEKIFLEVPFINKNESWNSPEVHFHWQFKWKTIMCKFLNVLLKLLAILWRCTDNLWLGPSAALTMYWRGFLPHDALQAADQYLPPWHVRLWWH